MQTQHPNSDQLISLLKQQADLYRKSIQLAQLIHNPSQYPPAKTSEQLQFLMQQVAGIDAEIAQLRPELERNGSLKSSQVQEAVADQERILRSLIGAVDESLGMVSQQQFELSRSLDGHTNRETMQNAYKVSMRTG